jgi:predicted DNA-binding transcriptional regulator YafY
MSWGDAVEVLEPPELRAVVATAVGRLAERYRS